MGGLVELRKRCCFLSPNANFNAMVAVVAQSRNCHAMVLGACAEDECKRAHGLSAMAIDRNMSSNQVSPEVSEVFANRPQVSNRIQEPTTVSCDDT